MIHRFATRRRTWIGLRGLFLAGLALLLLAGLPAAGQALGPQDAGGAAAGPGWTSYPIHGGVMRAIVVDPQNATTIYVGSEHAGVFKSTDGGQTWQAARNGLPNQPITSLRIDPLHANVVLAGTDGEGVWRSTDGGSSWVRFSQGLTTDETVTQIVFSPSDSNTVYIGIGPYSDGQIYKSTDGGLHWIVADNGIPRAYDAVHCSGILTLAIDPANPQVVYAGTQNAGAFRSADGGQNWVAINDGIPQSGGTPASVSAIALDPYHARRPCALISGNYYAFGADNRWARVNTEYHGPGYASNTAYIYYHPTDPNVIFIAGSNLAKSSNAGLDWSTLPVPGGDVKGIAFHPAAPNTLFAAGSPSYDTEQGGVYRSLNGGIQWSPAANGISATTLRAIAIDPQNNSSIFVGRGGSGGGGIWQSLDHGSTWVYKGLSSEIINIALDPLDMQKIYVADSSDLYESADGGQSYQVFNEVDQSPHCLAVMPNASSPVYVGTSEGIFKSPDAGLTWQTKNYGLPVNYSGNPIAILSLAVDPNAPNVLWAGTSGQGLVRSIDGAEHWQVKAFATNTGEIGAVAVKPGDSNTILIGIGNSPGDIYQSTDGGATWFLRRRGPGAVTSFRFDPRDPRIVYASTINPWAFAEAPQSDGVLRSVDGGAQWQRYDAGIFYPQVYKLAITNESAPLLLAGSDGSGLFGSTPPRLLRTYLPAATR